MNAIWKYYFDSTIYNLALSAFISLYTGIIWGLVIFGTIGTLVGFIVYSYFKESEYYFYYNYGYSKRALMIKVWGINLVVIIICLGLYATIINLI